MKIWIDADSCPARIREITCKAGIRLSLQCYFVANRNIPIPKTEFATCIETTAQDQAADNYIIQHVEIGDLVITRDIPLAKELVDKNIVVINDRGKVFTANDINTTLSVRNFMYELQSVGLKPESTNKFGKKEIQKFSATLDKELYKLINKFNYDIKI